LGKLNLLRPIQSAISPSAAHDARQAHGKDLRVENWPSWIAACLALVVPLIGLGSMLASRCARCEQLQRLDQLFFAALVLVTLTTVRGLLTHDPSWLVHGLTLGAMIIGGVSLPAPGEKSLRRKLVG
jgi:hypothetical protein